MTGTNKNVTLKVEKGYVVALPPELPNMNVGDTVTFNSDYDAFKVVFTKRWPFAGNEHVVRNNKPLTFARQGSFTFLCYVGTRPKKKPSVSLGHSSSGRINWVSYEGKGGTGSVKPPGR